MATRGQRQRYEARRRAAAPPCPDCGAYKNRESIRCRKCCNHLRTQEAATLTEERRVARQAYMRAYMKGVREDPLWLLRRRRVEKRMCRMRDCLFNGYEHHHCECGLVLSPIENACPMCLAEQRRIEFKTWPKEAA